jgi:hypothetical protein
MAFFDDRHFRDNPSRWTQEVFDRAYFTAPDAPFKRVCQWLTYGFSVLCYVPGSCMSAAMENVKKNVLGPWKTYDWRPGKDRSLDAAFGDMAGVLGSIRDLMGGERDAPPKAVFTNLDRIFLDNENRAANSTGTQLALFALVESTRNVPTLGLADRAFGPLPDAVEVAFNERLWLREIEPAVLVENLIPRELARHLHWRDHPGPGAWQLAARLRWSDPVHAVQLMRAVADPTPMTREGDLQEVVKWIWEACRPAQFEDPVNSFSGDPDQLTGFPPEVVSLLRLGVVDPYKRWQSLPNLKQEEHDRELRMLPPGVLFFGPPGTGKTYLARWMARSIGLPIRVVAGAELRDSRFGQTERNLIRLFQDARRAAPCVLVLDDADDLLVDRGKAEGSTSSADRAIVNTALQELSGFGGRIPGVLVVLTTNRYYHVDAAVRSRIPLHVHVPYSLNKDQVAEVVAAVARYYNYRIEKQGEVWEKLVQRFFEPVLKNRGAAAIEPMDRRQALDNLFSPRDIEQAMLLLRSPDTGTGTYTPRPDDVQRLIKYYEDLAEAPAPEPPRLR